MQLRYDLSSTFGTTMVQSDKDECKEEEKKQFVCIIIDIVPSSEASDDITVEIIGFTTKSK